MAHRLSPGQSSIRRYRFAALCVIACLPALPVSAQGLEHEVKAQLIERFTRFVEWPVAGDGSAPFVIGVLGDDPLHASLAGLSARIKIKGRAVEVRRLPDVEQALGCQLVFLSASRSGDLARLVALSHDKQFLSVGDGGDYGRQGVMINFYHEGPNVRFEINEASAKQAGLKVAADLLALARVIR